MTLRHVALCLGLGSLTISALGAEPNTPAKKLIEFGWDEPDTTFMREHVGEMERSPFDGCVFHIEGRKVGGSRSRFTWEAWGTRAYTEAEFQSALADLRATAFGRFTNNFLRFNTAPAKLDWFDDHAAALNNARLAAWVAREGHCLGVLFDVEQYEGQLFDYRKQKDSKEKSWERYAAQVRQRGREVMEAFQKGYPDLTVFLTFGYSLPWLESYSGKGSLADCHYGLLAPFLDGMIEATKGRSRLVDGHESSYGYKEPALFAAAARTMKEDLLPIVNDPANYRRVFSCGFGLWMDQDWRKVGWTEGDLSQNYFSPEAFEQSVRVALKTADEYVWIYTETPRWWSDAGKPIKLPQAYADALRGARSTVHE